MRAGECAEIRIQDLDLPGQRLIIRQGKGQRDRLVYLSALTCQAIQSYWLASPRQPTDYLWQQPNGHPISTHWLRQQGAQIGADVGIAHLVPQRLRHTCATRLLNAGMDIVHIQKLLGHEHLSSTMIYARVYDPTVEGDYRQALDRIARQQPPLSDQPIAVADWPTQTVKMPQLDNSV